MVISAAEREEFFYFEQHLALIYLKTFYVTDTNSEQIKNT